MKIGNLRHRVLVKRPAVTQSSSGETTPTYEPVATVWASVEPIRQYERGVANQVIADFDTMITMRRDPAVTAMDARWVLVHAGITYNIVGIANMESRNRELQIKCNAGLNDG